MISDADLLRYSRQIMLPDFDIAAQEALVASRVLIVGLGGLGSPVALYLAAAGVGKLHLADGDSVELSNLQRQIAHGEADLGSNKAVSAAAACRRINQRTTVDISTEHLSGDALSEAIAAVDLVVDATDSMVSRLAINAGCFETSTPLVSGAAIACEGQVTVIDTSAGTPCYRCLYPEASSEQDASCSENGVLAPIVGLIGSLQALEAVKCLTGYGTPLRGRLLLIDGRSLNMQTLTTVKNPSCPVCSERPGPAGA